MTSELAAIIEKIAAAGKGILAADESTGTIAKRFASIQLDNTEENRRDYREMLFTTPDLNQYISGVILFEETLTQKAKSGEPLASILEKQGIVPGIKVDKGLIPMINANDEKVTQGLDGLPERLATYKSQGAQFAKWRAIFQISDNTPSALLTHTNAYNLARYAAICQSQGIVPIVEPEILIDGDHNIKQCAEVTEKVLFAVFNALEHNKVVLEHIILKPSMVLPGSTAAKASPEQVANATIQVFKRTVPAAVPTINFLSGGQTPEEASANLNAMNVLSHLPWNMSFSYGRALQETALKAWGGKNENVEKGQRALGLRAKLNSAACLGKYQAEMETA